MNEIENKEDFILNDDTTIALDENSATPKKENFFKKLLTGMGWGSLILTGGSLSILFYVLHFLLIALIGLSMILSAIKLFLAGSIIWGLVVLLIATPIAIGIADFMFIPLLILIILTLAIWGICHLFGLNFSFVTVYTNIWLILKILIVGGLAFIGISLVVTTIKEKTLLISFKKNWLAVAFYILFFFFLIWWFF